MLRLAICVVAGALARTESRGAHFREDFPRRDDRAWLKRPLAFWRGPDDTLPTLDYETLDVTRMELPPGWRGYGGKDHIEHPDTARRGAEVTAIRDGHSSADRHEVQEWLMPYRHLLPPRLRGRNERLDEPFGITS
jgi:fumarate reductase flavoprotein subunit